MSRNVTGPLHTPAGAVIVDTKLRFRSLRHNSSLNGSSPIHSETSISISAIGEFTTNLLDGDYEVHLQYGQSYQNLGVIVIDPAELGTIKLGVLIDQYRNTKGDYSPSNLATQTWVQNYVGVGGSPADISLTSFKTNDGSTALQQLRKRADNGAIEWFTQILTPASVGLDVINFTYLSEIKNEATVNNQLLQSFHSYIVSPSNTVIFPLNPGDGDWIDLVADGNIVANPAVLNLQGNKLKGVATTTLNYDIKTAIRLYFTGAIYGWNI